MINISDVQNSMEAMRREELLKQHPYEIWQSKDGKWYTYLPAQDGGRVLKKRKFKNDLESIIIDYYKNKKEILLKDIFQEWALQKLEYGDIQKQTFDRYTTDFHRFFDNAYISKKDIRKITENDLEVFIRKTIRNMGLTNKAYGGLRLLVIGIFKYAKRQKYSEISITQFFGDLELPKKCFVKKAVKDDESVFTDDEVEKISNYIQKNPSLLNYGILLAFQTGVRVGELCTLKYSDIQRNKLCIRRTEVRYRDKDGKRIKEKAFSVKITKICKYVGIKERSMHKARKTYATKLINGGVDESLIIKQMGHTSIDCTKNYYYFNNKNDEEAIKQIERAISY